MSFLENQCGFMFNAGIAQLGEQQTEVTRLLEVPCSIHGPGIYFVIFDLEYARSKSSYVELHRLHKCSKS